MELKTFVFHRAENIGGERENTGYQHFLLFPDVFKRLFSKVSKRRYLILHLQIIFVVDQIASNEWFLYSQQFIDMHVCNESN